MSAKMFNIAVLMTLSIPSIVSITTKNPYWRLGMVLIPALMAINMKTQVTSTQTSVIAIPLVIAAAVGTFWMMASSKQKEAIKEGDTKRSLIFFSVLGAAALVGSGVLNAMNSNKIAPPAMTLGQPTAPLTV